MRRLKLWVVAVGVFVAALAASWFGGRKAAQADAKVDELEDRLFESARAKEIESDVEALSRDALRERSRVWVRGSDR